MSYERTIVTPITFDLDQFQRQKVVVFGDFMVDEYLRGVVTRVSPEAPVPVVHLCERSRRLGGAGNVVLNLSALGASVASIGFLGNDPEGCWMIYQLRSIGVDVSGMLQSEGVVTSIKTRVTAQNQQLLRYDQEVIQDAGPAFAEFLREKLGRLLEDACALILSDYGKGAVTEKTAQIAISAARALHLPIVVDPKGTHYEKYAGATVCTPNRRELADAVGRELNGEDEIRQAGTELCARCRIDFVLATRSEDGMSLICGKNGEKRDYPAIAKEVIDVTGAGDTVVSVFTLCYALGASMDDSCRLANLAASIVVSKFGAATASPDEIQELLAGYGGQSSRVLTMAEAAQRAAELRRQGKRIVFTNGCFDIVHAGHISSFRQAKQFGDVLFLGLNSDASIRRIKGDKRPIVSQKNRVALLEAIRYLDYIVLFDDDTPEALIQAICPDVLVKGKDWEEKTVIGGDFVQQYGGEVRFIELEAGLSTTNVIEKILDVYGLGTR